MRLFSTQLGKELHELWATRKALVVLVVMFALGLMSPISAKVLPDLVASLGKGQNVTIVVPTPTIKDALDQYVKNTTQLVMFVFLLVGFLSIVSERERGLMVIVFPHGLPRRTFVLAKFAALAIFFAAGMLVEALATYLYSALLFTPPDPGSFIAITLLMYIYLLMLVALALLASTLAQTTIAAAGITFTFVVVTMISSLLFNFAPGKLTEWASSLIVGLSVVSHWDALIASLVLMVIAIAASCVILDRQEITSAVGV